MSSVHTWTYYAMLSVTKSRGDTSKWFLIVQNVFIAYLNVPTLVCKMF